METATKKKASSRVFPELTKTEIGILRALIAGDKRIEIATAWGISMTSVQSHLKVINAKLAAKTTLHAIAIAMREKIV